MTSGERRLVFIYTTVMQAKHLLEHAVGMTSTGLWEARVVSGEEARAVSDAMLAAEKAADGLCRKMDEITDYEGGAK